MALPVPPPLIASSKSDWALGFERENTLRLTRFKLA